MPRSALRLSGRVRVTVVAMEVGCSERPSRETLCRRAVRQQPAATAVWRICLRFQAEATHFAGDASQGLSAALVRGLSISGQYRLPEGQSLHQSFLSGGQDILVVAPGLRPILPNCLPFPCSFHRC